MLHYAVQWPPENVNRQCFCDAKASPCRVRKDIDRIFHWIMNERRRSAKGQFFLLKNINKIMLLSIIS